jgi:Protein of unknown function (DUF1553)/Protein of unknown function (DUF1549)/Planctomycete cytochrome C
MLTWRQSLFAALLFLAGAGNAQAEEGVDYARQIKPLFARRCYACHGALKQQSGLRLDTAAAMHTGGSGGPAIEAGKSSESLLVEALTGASGVARMPPEEAGEALKSDEILLIRRWIDEGAKAPADELPQPDPLKHWAFQRVERPPLPAAVRPGVPEKSQNPIDAFVYGTLERQGLVPSAPAEKQVLLRRVYLDLLGLPPTRDELHAFLDDTADDAYEKVVDRLLSSPQYGERWARHWMDVWRYSDWYGRRAVPDVWNSAPQVWRWRDWIVRSLNDDKGYDRMVLEMLAGDEIAPEDDETAVATGYIIRNWYALNSHQWMKDMVEHTGKAFLGLTLNCAHCHDHKYDPVSHEEYFRFRAFFEPVQIRQDWVAGEPNPGPFQKYEYAVLRKIVPSGSVRIFDENLAAETHMYRQGDERARIEGRSPVTPAAPAFLGGSQLAITPVDLPPRAYYPGLKPFIQTAEIESREQSLLAARTQFVQAQHALVTALERQTEIEEQRRAVIEQAPTLGTQPPPVDPKWRDRRDQAQASVFNAQNAARMAEAKLATAQAQLDSIKRRIAADRIRYLGEPGSIDEASLGAARAERTAAWRASHELHLAAEQALAAARHAFDAAAGAAKEQAGAALKAAEQQSAAALAAAETARAAIDQPATTYSPISPVYPAQSTGRRRALAQWIASRENPLAARVAVNHIWKWHFGRPLVETVSDFGINGKRPSHPELLDWLAAELMDSGWKMKRLHRQIVTSAVYTQRSLDGRSASANLAADADNRWLWHFPPQRIEAEVVRDSLLYVSGQLDLSRLGGAPFENAQEVASRRRSLYFSVYPEDGGHPRFLELFDAPDPCDCYRRTESLVPQQALALVNSQLARDQSRLLAQSLWNAHPPSAAEPSAREARLIALAFEQVLSRLPTDHELAACGEFLARQQAVAASSPAPQAPAGSPSNDPALRAFASLVHTLINHNDFVTVR